MTFSSSNKDRQTLVDPPELVTRGEVRRLTSLSVTSIYRLMKRDQFPRPIRISQMRVAWLLSEVCDWIEQRAKKQRAAR